MSESDRPKYVTLPLKLFRKLTGEGSILLTALPVNTVQVFLLLIEEETEGQRGQFSSSGLVANKQKSWKPASEFLLFDDSDNCIFKEI